MNQCRQNTVRKSGYITRVMFSKHVRTYIFQPSNTFKLFFFNTLWQRQNGCHFVDNIFKCIFMNVNVWILFKMSLKFVPNGPINIILSLVQIMACGRPGEKPLFEPIMVRLLTHICVTWPQWVNTAFHAIQTKRIHPHYMSLYTPFKHWLNISSTTFKH